MKRSWWKSLRVKIIAWSFVPTVIILSAVAGFTFYSYQKVVGDRAIQQFPDIAQPKAQLFYSGIARLFSNTTIAIFLNIDLNHELPLEDRAQIILEQAPFLDLFDGGVYFLDQQGKIFKTQPPQPELIGQDWSDTPHFRSINETPNMSATTDLITIPSSGKKIFCSATAMTGQVWTEVVGASYLCFTIYPVTQNAYYQMMDSLDLGPDLCVVDRNQQIVYSADPAEISKDLSGEAYIQKLSTGERKSGRFHIGNQDRVISYIPVAEAPINRVNWHVLLEESWTDIMQPTMSYRRLLLILLALGLIVPVLVTAYGVRHITHPIQKLIQAAEQVTAGQFKHCIEVKTGDEIETLADQFNLMSAELDESYASLEKKVADRTRELAVINAILSVANRSLDIQEILEDSLKITVEQMGLAAGAAFKLDPNSTTPLLATQQGFERAVAQDLSKIAPTTGPINTTDRPSLVVSMKTTDLPDEKLRHQVAQSGVHTLGYVPLSAKGRHLGLFILGKHGLGPLSTEELTLLSSIGQQIGVAIENALLYEQAEQTAITVERNRLARELHDAVTQTLFSASLIADVIPRIWRRNPEEGLQNLEELRQLTRGALAEMRTLLLEMRPESLERADLKSLIKQLTDAFVGRVRIPLNLQINGDCELTHEVKLVFYRVMQEALNNIAKHSGARQVEVHLECQPGQMNLFIKDDGLGFEVGSITPDHLGIAIMRERANSIGASFKIEGLPGQGTTVALGWKSA